MSEPFSIEYSIGKGDADIAEWYFKIHYGRRASTSGGWCSTRYVYVKNYRIEQSIDYLPPGPLLPENSGPQIVSFSLSLPQLNYNLRTIDQEINIEYLNPANNQILTQKTKIFKLNIPVFSNDYEVRKHIGVWIPEKLRL